VLNESKKKDCVYGILPSKEIAFSWTGETQKENEKEKLPPKRRNIKHRKLPACLSCPKSNRSERVGLMIIRDAQKDVEETRRKVHYSSPRGIATWCSSQVLSIPSRMMITRRRVKCSGISMVFSTCVLVEWRSSVQSLSEQACATGLDGIDLSLRPAHASEAGGELVSVEEFTLLRSDGAEGSARVASNCSVGERGASGAVQWAMLLSLCTVGHEGVRKLVCWRCRVDAGSVVNGLGDRSFSDELDERGSGCGSFTEDGSGTHFDSHNNGRNVALDNRYGSASFLALVFPLSAEEK